MAGSFGAPDNTELSYKCPRCGNMFQANPKVASTCPICSFTCSESKCRQLDASNEDY